MNDPSQVDIHKGRVLLLYCYVDTVEGGYHGRCPLRKCPWTSGIRETKELAQKAYYRHLAYILNKMGE